MRYPYPLPPLTLTVHMLINFPRKTQWTRVLNVKKCVQIFPCCTEIKAANLVKRFYAKSINKFSSRYVFYVHKKAEKMKLGLVFSD